MSAPRNVDILVGLAAGSEAKGKLASVIAADYQFLVRTGSVNAAHTTYFNGEGLPWHQIPCTPLHAPEATLVLGAGAQIDLKYLNREIQWLKDRGAWLDKNGRPRLLIDPNATLIEKVDVDAENGWQDVCGPQWYAPTTCDTHNSDKNPDGVAKKLNSCEGCHLYPAESLHKSLGSTTHGSGFNLIRKLARTSPDKIHAGLLRDAKGNKIPKVRLAGEVLELAPYIEDTVAILNMANDNGQRILLEGTQGSVLSMHHGPWPKTTSRDTNASNWCMEAGLAPTTVRKVYGVTRTYPIRVAGDSGPMGGVEITWEDVTKFAYGIGHLSEVDAAAYMKAHNLRKIEEITTATKRKRRVFQFSIGDFQRAFWLNRPDEIMLSFIDYLDISNFGKSSWDQLTAATHKWINELERTTGAYFRFLSTGPETHQIIDRGER